MSQRDLSEFPEYGGSMFQEIVYDDGTSLQYAESSTDDWFGTPTSNEEDLTSKMARANLDSIDYEDADYDYGTVDNTYGDNTYDRKIVSQEGVYGDDTYGGSSGPVSADNLYGDDTYGDGLSEVLPAKVRHGSGVNTARGFAFTNPQMAEIREQEFYGTAQLNNRKARVASDLPAAGASNDLRDKTYGQIVFGDLPRPKCEALLKQSVERTRAAGRIFEGTFLLRASASVINGVVVSVYSGLSVTHWPFQKPTGSPSYVNSKGKKLGQGLVGLIEHFQRHKEGLPCLLKRQILPAKTI